MREIRGGMEGYKYGGSEFGSWDHVVKQRLVESQQLRVRENRRAREGKSWHVTSNHPRAFHFLHFCGNLTLIITFTIFTFLFSEIKRVCKQPLPHFEESVTHVD